MDDHPVSGYLHLKSIFFGLNWHSPSTHSIIINSVQLNWVVLMRKIWRGWSVIVSLGRFLTPANRSEALRTRSPKKSVNDTAWATNFMKGLRRTWPTYKKGEAEIRQIIKSIFSHIFYIYTYVASCVDQGFSNLIILSFLSLINPNLIDQFYKNSFS